MKNTLIDELVRDFTEVTPRPKSEVRRRLKKFEQQARSEAIEEVLACRPTTNTIFREIPTYISERKACNIANKALNDWSDKIKNLK